MSSIESWRVQNVLTSFYLTLVLKDSNQPQSIVKFNFKHFRCTSF